jgi:light-regulated signal transduction histidine kinase (bacteriophytochrome)
MEPSPRPPDDAHQPGPFAPSTDHEGEVAALRRRVIELTALSEELESFSYSVCHDLRAPLGRIAGFSDLLLTHAKGLDAQGRHFAQVIARSASQMNNLIQDLLEFSRMSRGEARMGEVDLAVLAKKIILTLEPETAGRRIAWRIGKLPKVQGDASMLAIVLQNLLSNAVKFTRYRKDAVIELGCKRGCADQCAETVLFVHDNGAGFDMAKAGALFTPFHRLHDPKQFEGTGVGLAIVRRILMRHGGRIWAESRPELGATFYFSLPSPAPRGPGPAKGLLH